MLLSSRIPIAVHRGLWSSAYCRTLATRTRASIRVPEPSSAHNQPLYGTVTSHRLYLFLHVSQPPETFPPRVLTPIQRALQLRASRWGGIVNFSWFKNHHDQDPPLNAESHSATAFSASGGRLEIPKITLENLDHVDEMLRWHAEGAVVPGTEDEIHLYVCTHAARDCRCGNLGSGFVNVLRKEVEKRFLLDPSGAVAKVKIGETGHVGGHQYAANLLIFPHGEWLGLMRPDDAPTILDVVLNSSTKPLSSDAPPMLPAHWRGRIGLAKDEQIQLYSTHIQQ